MKWNNVANTTPVPGTQCLIRDKGTREYRCASFSASSDWVFGNSRCYIEMYPEWIPLKSVSELIDKAPDRFDVIVESATRDGNIFRFTGTNMDTHGVVCFVAGDDFGQTRILEQLAKTPVCRLSFDIDDLETTEIEGCKTYSAVNIEFAGA